MYRVLGFQLSIACFRIKIKDTRRHVLRNVLSKCLTRSIKRTESLHRNGFDLDREFRERLQSTCERIVYERGQRGG